MKTETLSKLSEQFCQKLIQEDRSAGTVEKYMRDIRAFSAWIKGKELNKKQQLNGKSIYSQGLPAYHH